MGEEGRMVREQSCGGPLGNRIRHGWGAGRCRAWPGVFWKTFVSGVVCEHFPWTWEHKPGCPWGPAPGIAGQATFPKSGNCSSSNQGLVEMVDLKDSGEPGLGSTPSLSYL